MLVPVVEREAFFKKFNAWYLIVMLTDVESSASIVLIHFLTVKLRSSEWRQYWVQAIDDVSHRGSEN